MVRTTAKMNILHLLQIRMLLLLSLFVALVNPAPLHAMFLKSMGLNVPHIIELLNASDKVAEILLEKVPTKEDTEQLAHKLRQCKEILTSTASQTELHKAAEQGDKAAIQDLIKKGYRKKAKDSDGNIPLFNAVRNGHFKVFHLLVDHDPQILANHKNKSGETPLHWAVKFGTEECIRTLLALEADLNAEDTTKATPLHWATRYFKHPIISYLLQQGAAKTAQDNKGRTAAHYALMYTPTFSVQEEANQYAEVLKTLLHAGYLIADSSNKLPLHYASELGNTSVIKALIRFGTKVEEQDGRGRTPLHYAIENNHVTSAKLLIHGFHARPNIQDHEDMTPLHLAVMKGNEECIQLLMDLKVSLHTRDNEGQTPIHRAIILKSKPTLTTLIEWGTPLDVLNSNGHTPLLLAAALGFYEGVLTLCTWRQPDKKTLYSAACIAAAANQIQVLAYVTWKLKILDASERPKNKDGEGQQSPTLNTGKHNNPPPPQQIKTPLHYACEAGSTHAASYLLTHLKDNIIQQDQNGYSPLHYAVRGGKVDVAKMLLLYGSDGESDGNDRQAQRQRIALQRLLTLRDKTNKTPGDYAKDAQMKTLFEPAEVEKKGGAFSEFASDVGALLKDFRS